MADGEWVRLADYEGMRKAFQNEIDGLRAALSERTRESKRLADATRRYLKADVYGEDELALLAASVESTPAQGQTKE